MAGWCDSYVVGLSLGLPEAKAVMSKAMPMLTGEFTKQEVSVAGGPGL